MESVRIGMEFYRYTGKNPVKAKVVDVHTTTNLAGEIVSVYYVCEHEFCGQVIKSTGIPAAMIIRNLIENAR